MGQSIKVGTMNQLQKGDVLYAEGTGINSIALILKGNIVCSNAAINITLGPGEFVGVNDLYIGSYSATALAATDCAVYVLEAKTIRDLSSVMKMKQEYRGYLIKSLNRYLLHMYESYYSVLGVANDILDESKAIMKAYTDMVYSYGGDAERVHALDKLEAFSKQLPVKPEWVDMLKELQQVPVEVVANYYSYIPNATLREMEEKIKICTIFMSGMKQMAAYVANVSGMLISEGSDCVFKALCRSIMTLSESHANYRDMINLVDRVVGLVNRLEEELEKRLGQADMINRSQLEALYYSIISGVADEEVLESKESEEDILRILSGSLQQILSFSNVDQEIRTKFTSELETFRELKDKNSISDEVRALRRSLTEGFFAIYRSVFMRAYQTENQDKVIKMFLQFGYIDECLLTPQQLVDLYRLDVKSTVTHYCNCYTIYDWLVEVYEGRKEVSKNDMDQEYRDYIRHTKGKLTAAEEKIYLEDMEAKLEFELTNMFQHNMKLTNGRVSTYVPFLYEQVMPYNIEKYFLTPMKIDEALRDILKVDFSAFYREVIYTNPSIEIQRELVQKSCVPDVILFPTSGTNGIMWQETAGKKRDSAGRFCLAIINEGILMDTMIKLVGRFRWELCRTVQGLAWNDISNKCLTSEYSDYIQFYRRNKDLSEDKREKVKLQIQKARNNVRECFAMDYELWIKFEVNGSIRLNKTSRDILGLYCPFTKEIRAKLADRPQYAESIMKLEKEMKSKSRILDAKILRLAKSGYEVPKELELTAAYYQNK